MITWQMGMTIKDIEKQIILEAYKLMHENKTKTAQVLGISIRTLDSRLENYGYKPANSADELNSLQD